ncbi:MAG: hypothetical protein HKO13_01470 [Sphingomonas sp.]|nr:hypothetical protein [Sphingomonas sp.]
MTELISAPAAEINLIRISSLIALVVILISYLRREIPEVLRGGYGWVRDEARRCREQSGYVGAVLGRYSILMAGSSMGFAVFRSVNFLSETAKAWASTLSGLALLLGLVAGSAVFSITGEIIRQAKH